MDTEQMNKQDFVHMFDNLSISVYVVNLKYIIVYANSHAVQELFNGVNPLKKSIFDVFKNLSKENSSFVKVIETGIADKEKLLNYVDIDGKRRISISSTYPLIRNNEIIGAYEFGDDITGINSLVDQYKIDKSFRRVIDVKQSIDKENDFEYYTLDSIIGRSEKIIELKNQIMLSATTDSSLLIYGETGTGKELVAQSIFSLSKNNKTDPFIAFNCAAIPETLLESILFGTVKGSYTGAENKPGLFELAHGGVMFLDEINSMSLSLQAKILRVIEEGKVRRVGGNKEISVKFRLISSTNVDPQKLIEKEIFRSDLFFRISVLNINIPPLRKRTNDIPLLVNFFIETFNQKRRQKIMGIHNEALKMLLNYDWPGNVRELKNVLERAMTFCNDKMISSKDIQLNFFKTDAQKYTSNTFIEQDNRIILKDVMMKIEKDIIKHTLLKTSGNVAKAARELDIPQQTLNSKIDRFSLRKYKSTYKSSK